MKGINLYYMNEKDVICFNISEKGFLGKWDSKKKVWHKRAVQGDEIPKGFFLINEKTLEILNGVHPYDPDASVKEE